MSRPVVTQVLVLLSAAVVLGVFTTYTHTQQLGQEYLNGVQLWRHNMMIGGQAGNPWQYRMLTTYVIQVAWIVMTWIGATNPVVAAFTVVRLIIDCTLFFLTLTLCRRFGLSVPQSVLGGALLALGIGYSNWGAGLSFDTYLDVVFYAGAAHLVLARRYLWLVPLTALAAFNRETSGLIPVIGLAMIYLDRAEGDSASKRDIVACVAALGVYALIFVWLRQQYPAQALVTAEGHQPGLDTFMFNLGRSVTWYQLVATMSLVPAVALFGYRTWPRELKVLFWAITPLWFLVHAFGAILAESRLLLVPQALVFIPGALLYAQSCGRDVEKASLEEGALTPNPGAAQVSRASAGGEARHEESKQAEGAA